MSKKYLAFDRHMKDIPAEVLHQKLGNFKDSELMRTIIINERDFLSVDYYRSQRGFWYSTVKPILDKLGKLTEADNDEESLKAWDKTLSRYISELVRLGELTYNDLMIIDTSRQRQTPSDCFSIVDIKTYGYQISKKVYPNIIISTEKDTVYSIISDIAVYFGVSCISGGGQNSFGAMEDLLRKMSVTNEDIYVLTLTDYDPSGYSIAETFKSQIEDLKKSLNIESNVYLERIGILPEQLTKEELENNKYTPKPLKLDEWFEKTGGINGEKKGLELDALHPDRIKELFVTSLKKYINEEKYHEFMKESCLKKFILRSIQPQVNQVIDSMIHAFSDCVNIGEDSLFEHANNNRYIPIDELCFINNTETITEKALELLKNS